MTLHLVVRDNHDPSFFHFAHVPTPAINEMMIIRKCVVGE